ncbi:MAG: hypothetical protein HFH68_14400 [Lachnospiraceae bacterium]|nr:hypothetical protein [Lachnospiraceae bacterium]
MNQYRRIVSYLYQYLNGEKGQNIGYARLEQKGRQCRVTVQMRAVETSFMPEVWLFKQEPSAIEYVSIGRLSAHSGSLQVKTVTNAEDVCSSGHPASDFDGAVIYISDKEYYATTWTNESIFIGNKINMLARDANNKSGEEAVKETVEDISRNTGASTGKGVIADSISPAGMAVAGKTRDNVTATNSNVDNSNKNNISEGISVEVTGDGSGNADGGKEDIIKADAVKENSQVNTDNNNNGNNSKSNVKEDIKTVDRQEEQEADIKTQDIEEEKSVYGCSACPYKSYNKKDEDFGVRILRNFPVMYPFRSGNIEESVRIEPKDIGCMPIRLWSFANNRFLLHGYYCYKHLIFAKLSSGCYALGVPGVFSDQESKRAAAFSFNSFQPIGPGKVMYGVFGYWIAEINV